jgi:hypothetical protein
MRYQRKPSHAKKVLSLNEINRAEWRKRKKKKSKVEHPEDIGLLLGWTKTRSELKRETTKQIREALAA